MDNSMNSSMNSSMNNAMNNPMNNSMNNSMSGNAMMPMGNPVNMMGNSMGAGMPNMTMNPNIGGGGGVMNVRNNSSNGSMRTSSATMMNSNMNSSGGMNGSWQTDRDTQHRRDMIQHIVKMLKKDRNGSPEWLSKLPQMAKQLEVSLYRNARSFEAYTDMNTLKQRLQQIAAEVSKKARDQRDDRQRDRMPSSNNSNSNYLGMASSNPSIPSNSIGPGNVANNNAMDMNGMRGNAHSRMRRVGGSNFQDQRAAASSGNRASGNRGMGNSLSSGIVSNSTGSSNRDDPEWRVRIRHKQQRLLLLHHSAKCPHEDGRCPVTPHCADMKRLWKHMEGCKDNQCRVPHCFSSRAILSHYRKCKDVSCPACGPVRDTVRRSQNRNTSNSNMSLGQSRQSRTNVGEGQRMGADANTSGQPKLSSHANSYQPSLGNSFNQSQDPKPLMPPSGDSLKPQYPSMQPSSQSLRSSGTNNDVLGGQSVKFRQSSTVDSGAVDKGARETPNGASVGGEQQQGKSGNSNPSARRNDSEWQKVRHKQQRLLLLRHASRCQYKNSCPVTPHCASMKKLWEHIAHCKDQRCSVPHCMSSRYVLSHYRRCKDARCPACAPVRDTIRKSHEKERQGQSAGLANSFDTEKQVDPSSTAFDTGFAVSSETSTSGDNQRSAKRSRVDHGLSLPVASSVIGGQLQNANNFDDSVKKEPQSNENSGSKGSQSLEGLQKESTPKPVQGASQNAQTSEDRSLLNSFSVSQLSTHLESLNRVAQLSPAKIKQKCMEVLKGLQAHQHGWVFNSPVDPVELGLPDYFEVIKKPMDLGTISKKLDSCAYHDIGDFQRDVNLTFDNAMRYNEEGTVVYGMAKELKDRFEEDNQKLVEQLKAEDWERRQNDRACVLCGCEKRLFESPVFFCNGLNCQSKRIPRNRYYYIGGNNQYFWCNQCYNDLDENTPLEFVDLTVNKVDLKKKKNDEVHEESWVQCDVCEKWIHQICGLFNTRQNKEHQSEYCCPLCLLEKRKKATSETLPLRPPGAADLPRTKLSEYLEKDVTKRIGEKKQEITGNGQSIDAGSVIIRQVTSMDRKHEVREKMKRRYKHKNYPDEFPFRCKCIVVFQHIDGVDVVLFALYLYEHGEDNPAPNKRCVYISYLDSVHFMRPRRLRTFVYHEILISYLDFARHRGFATAHIWACPPLKGDDYIFYAKPEDQKTPRDSRLRQWYIDMLVECQRRNVVGKVTNMYDLYFANESLDATAVPYLEGDYFPGEAENIIKVLENGGNKKGGNAGKKSKKKNQTKSKSRSGTRSAGMDDDMVGSVENTKNAIEIERDQVMVKLGETIKPMKESFIVAFLNWAEATKEDMEVPDVVMKYRAEHPEAMVPLVTGRKRDADGNTRGLDGPLDSNGRPMKVIDDDVEDLDCEFLNNRQAFLNLCRGNHYQFDELRRAKHTSMMVLWHLHNRNEPKFVQQCVHCNREILSGIRYHCAICSDYDLCEKCHKDPKTNRGSCTHKLHPIAVESEGAQEGQGNSNGVTAQQRKQRQRNLLLHIQLIEHASRCSSSSCTSTNCAKMKKYLMHGKTCKIKVQGGCRICKRIWTLLRIHAQKCKDEVCPIPQCMVIREKMRELQKQQQAMDDRRRLEMNRHYRMSIAGADNL